MRIKQNTPTTYELLNFYNVLTTMGQESSGSL